MTSRIEGDPLDHAWRSSTGGSPLVTLDLGPLRDDEADALAHAYVDASASWRDGASSGPPAIPLFLDQLLRHAEESAEDGVPGSVQSLVQARLDHLSPAGPAGGAGGCGVRATLRARRAAPSRGRPAATTAPPSSSASLRAPDRRRLPVRARADPRWRLRHRCSSRRARAAPAGRRVVRGARPGAPRRASRSGRRPGRARRLPGGGARASSRPIATSRRSLWPSAAWRSPADAADLRADLPARRASCTISAPCRQALEAYAGGARRPRRTTPSAAAPGSGSPASSARPISGRRFRRPGSGKQRQRRRRA